MEFPSEVVIADLGSNRLAVMSRLKMLFHLSPQQVKELCSTLPIVVARGMLSDVVAAIAPFEALGVKYEIRPWIVKGRQEYHLPSGIK